MEPRALFLAAVDYLKENPDEMLRVAVNALALRFGLPLAALRYLAKNAAPRTKKEVVKDLSIDAVPPGLRLGGTVDAMGTKLRASAAIRVDEVTVTSEAIRIGFRLSDVKLSLAEPSEAPIATLIQSGALDLSKPGNLVKFIPKRPPAIVDAEGDRIVIDLLKVPKLAQNMRLRRILAIVAPLIGVRAVESGRNHLYVALRATPAGAMRALEAIRER